MTAFLECFGSPMMAPYTRAETCFSKTLQHKKSCCDCLLLSPHLQSVLFSQHSCNKLFSIKLCDTLHVINKNTGKFLCLLDLFLFSHILTCHFVYVVSVLFEVSCAMCIKIIVIQDVFQIFWSGILLKLFLCTKLYSVIYLRFINFEREDNAGSGDIIIF